LGCLLPSGAEKYWASRVLAPYFGFVGSVDFEGPNFSLDHFQMIAFASTARNNAAVLPRVRACPRAKNFWTILDRESAFSCIFEKIWKMQHLSVL
jgi:hypothetical protein